MKPFLEETWKEWAACRGVGPDAFFPVDRWGRESDRYIEAMRLCFQCTVRASCREYAITNNLDAGYWGGLSPVQRKRLRKKRQSEDKRSA